MQYSFIFFRFTLAWLLLGIATGTGATTQTDRTTLDFTPVNEYAVLSSAAYSAPESVRRLLAETRYKLTHDNMIPGMEVSYLLVTDDQNKTQIISVRGTSNVQNALLDAEIKLVMDQRAGVRLHQGFARAAQAVFDDVKNHLKKDYKISTTGHSLGGAVALILALYLDLDGFDIERVVTFGQPKVTNIAGAAKFDRLDVVRVVTPRDVVPLVPPLDVADINNLDIYWHAGREIVLLKGTDYAILEGIDSMLRATRFTQQQPDEDNLKQHQMSRYMNMLDDKTRGAKQVPWTNSLNLFNLFGNENQ